MEEKKVKSVAFAAMVLLAVSFIDLMVVFTCTLIHDSPPPPLSLSPFLPPPSGGGKPGIIDSPL